MARLLNFVLCQFKLLYYFFLPLPHNEKLLFKACVWFVTLRSKVILCCFIIVTDAYKESKSIVLVYSKLGISRSAAVAIAYLMYDRKCKLKASLCFCLLMLKFCVCSSGSKVLILNGRLFQKNGPMHKKCVESKLLAWIAWNEYIWYAPMAMFRANSAIPRWLKCAFQQIRYAMSSTFIRRLDLIKNTSPATSQIQI